MPRSPLYIHDFFRLHLVLQNTLYIHILQCHVLIGATNRSMASQLGFHHAFSGSPCQYVRIEKRNVRSIAIWGWQIGAGLALSPTLTHEKHIYISTCCLLVRPRNDWPTDDWLETTHCDWQQTVPNSLLNKKFAFVIWVLIQYIMPNRKKVFYSFLNTLFF